MSFLLLSYITPSLSLSPIFLPPLFRRTEGGGFNLPTSPSSTHSPDPDTSFKLPIMMARKRLQSLNLFKQVLGGAAIIVWAPDLASTERRIGRRRAARGGPSRRVVRREKFALRLFHPST